MGLARQKREAKKKITSQRERKRKVWRDNRIYRDYKKIKSEWNNTEREEDREEEMRHKEKGKDEKEEDSLESRVIKRILISKVDSFNR